MTETRWIRVFMLSSSLLCFACSDSSTRDRQDGFDGILTLPDDSELEPTREETMELDAGSAERPQRVDAGRDAGSCLDGGECALCADAGCASAPTDAGMCSATSPCPNAQVCSEGRCIRPLTIGQACVVGRLCGTGAHCLNGRCVETMQVRYCHCLSLSGKPASLRLEVADVSFPYVTGLRCSECQPVPTGKGIPYRVYRQDGSLERASRLDLDPSWNAGEVSIFSIKDGAGVFEYGCRERVVCPQL